MKEKYLWVDVLRVFAMAAVVVVHVAADIITEWRSVPASGWWAANFYDSLARGAVPVFVMISGALLLPRTESYRDFFRKRFQRIAIPFIAWTVFYLLWRKYFQEPSLGLPEAAKRIASGEVHFHLWFLYLITGLYLVTPLLRVFTAHATRRDLLYFLGLCFLVGSLVPCWARLDSLFFHTGLRFRIPVEMAQGFLGYFLLGFALLKGSEPSSIRKAGLLWFAAFLICFLGSGWVVFHANQFPALVYDNLAPNIVLYAASLFVIAKKTVSRLETRWSAGVKQVLRSLSAASFGIYLIHPVFIDIFNHGRLGFVLNANTGHPAWSIPVTALVIYLCSYLIVLAIRKVPLLRATV
ncbi:MAG: acyltransferase family protein [Candidatus Omnitrophota bacterium]